MHVCHVMNHDTMIGTNRQVVASSSDKTGSEIPAQSVPKLFFHVS